MGIDLYPRIDADGQTLELEISPSGVSTNTPIHPALRATGPGGDLEKKGAVNEREIVLSPATSNLQPSTNLPPACDSGILRT